MSPTKQAKSNGNKFEKSVCVCVKVLYMNSEYNPLEGDICAWMLSTCHAENHPNGQVIFLAKGNTDKTLANILFPHR